MKKPRVLYVSGDVRTGGGGRGVSTLILEALAREFDLTHLCTVPPDLPAVDAWFGSNLSGLTWKTVRPSSFERWLVRCIPGEGAFHEVNYVLRCAKRIAPEFDVTFACCDMEADVGAPGIQYLHYPYFGDRPWRRWLPGDAAPLRLAGALLAGRTDPWMAISGYDVERSRRNLTLTNSHWTARRISALLDIESTVVYPPALGRFPEAAWETRADGFVSIGQLERGKRFDWIIDTMALVHRQWPAVQLHLCCHQDPRWVEAKIVHLVERKVREANGWVHLHWNLSRVALGELLSRNRYGIHAKFEEHFGMAPAEIASSGALPFVHDSGGQVEIVGHDPRLCFDTPEDAATKILDVMRNPALQDELRAQVSTRAEQFAPKTFQKQIVEQVHGFLERKL